MKAICMLAIGAAIAVAQEQPRHTVVYERTEAGVAGVRVAGSPAGPEDVLFNKEVIITSDKATMGFVTAEISVDGKALKGAPYSAETVNETVQTLSDGNRIVHKSTGAIYRDSEGRIRREQTIDAIGPWSTSSEPMKTIIINDNVAGATYFLDSRSKEARKVPSFQPVADKMAAEAHALAGAGAGAGTMIKMRSGGAPPPQRADVKEESLGKRNIEGLICDGTRVTSTIPAGVTGNEKPIETVSERWYSPELQVVVLSKHKDPRMGESTYRLERVSRNEPARSLFDVPADFTVVNDAPRTRTFRVEKKD
jgi:hypothetical protein